MTTMVVGGFWHGANWTFVIWGALHGGVLALERAWKDFRPPSIKAVPAWLGLVITFHVVCLGWIFFRAESFQAAVQFIGGFGHWGAEALAVTPLAVVLILAGLALHALPPRMIEDVAVRTARLKPVPFGLAIGLLILLVDAVRPDGVPPFIYYQF
jgi:D-alanyl-lipoteichoic acid acyltransferase DltB (MBOAT superfamily)